MASHRPLAEVLWQESGSGESRSLLQMLYTFLDKRAPKCGVERQPVLQWCATARLELVRKLGPGRTTGYSFGPRMFHQNLENLDSIPDSLISKVDSINLECLMTSKYSTGVVLPPNKAVYCDVTWHVQPQKPSPITRDH